MAINLGFQPIPEYLIGGIPASGGKLFCYAAGTTTKQATFTDSTGTVQQTNPIIFNTRGEPSSGASSVGVWLTSGINYKFVLAPATDTDPPTNPIWTVDNVSGGSTTSTFYDIPFRCLGATPAASEIIDGMVFCRAINFTADLPGAYGQVRTNPAASWTANIQKNGTNIGTIVVSTSGVFTFSTSGIAQSFAAGDSIQFVAPSSADGTIQNIYWTLTGTPA